MQRTLIAPRAARRRHRRGVSTIWVLAGLPALIAAFLVIAELGHLWQARVELENALEAAALGAAKEWGQNGGSPAANWTSSARLRGQTLAAANTIDGQSVLLGTNLGAFSLAGNPNENSAYLPGVGPPPTGNLVFGAVTEIGDDVTFDATDAPQCGGGIVLVDASGSGNLFSGSRNEWGISFQFATDPTLRIVRVEIDVSTASVASRFDQLPELDTTPDTFSSAKVKDQSTFQQDIAGFALINNTMNAGQIVASFPNTQTLRLDFSAGGGDDGFAMGDRFRFAQRVTNLNGNNQRDGDEVGGTTIRVTFNTGVTVTGVLFDNTDVGLINPHLTDPLTGSFIVSPTLIPDLPQSPTSAPGNNGQSYLRISGGGVTEYFGVRAQATTRIPSLFGGYFGLPFASHVVTVDTTAIYDCITSRTRLVRVDNYIHP